MKIPVEVKEKWVKALRSGEYKQGQCWLYDKEENSFCCLGVICDIYEVPRKAMRTGFPYRIAESLPNDFPTNLLGDPSTYTTNVPALKQETDGNILAKMNDGGESFAKIADWIEENL